ncbi:flavin reductase family protein [Candidatus Bathyarchaeota archaeon]|nr:flavin reductase family protein [Candidatus Bathyarchaeota archaeon]
MSEKIDVEFSSAYRLLHPMHTVLVSCVGKAGKPNVLPLAWAMPTSRHPALIAVSVAPSRYSHRLIEETKEFVVNLPTVEIVKETLFCGRTSGKKTNKFDETELTPMPAKKVKAPIIEECVAHLECILHNQFKTGDHTIFVGEVVAAYANKGVFIDTYNIDKARMLYHLGGNVFATLDPKLYNP